MTYKRCRRSCKHKRDQKAFEQRYAILKAFLDAESKDQCSLYYFDESGFSLIPNVPYAWQEIGETLAIPSQHSRRLNVLGFLNQRGELHYSATEGKVTSEVVIAAFDDFIQQTDDDKPRVIVIDDVSMHTSRLFRETQDKWLEKNVHIVRLPTYSPELNLIEILWRMVKYYWVNLSAYVDFDSLKEEVIRVLNDYGTKYEINFD